MVTFLKSLRRLSSIMGSDILRTDPWLSLYTAQQKPFVTKQTKKTPFVTVLNEKARYTVLLRLWGLT